MEERVCFVCVTVSRNIVLYMYLSYNYISYLTFTLYLVEKFTM